MSLRSAAAASVTIIKGDANRDFLTGTDGPDQIYGLGGDDDLRGGAGSDTLRGGAGDDFLVGDSSSTDHGRDVLMGGSGDDTLIGGRGDDRYFGGDGTDTAMFADFGVDSSSGVVVDLNVQDVAQDTGQGLDTLSAIENVSGTSAADALTGDGGDNVLFTRGGNDTVWGGDGNDTVVVNADFLHFKGFSDHLMLDGGAGSDILSFEGARFDTSSSFAASGRSTDFHFDLRVESEQATGFGNLTATNFENVVGTLLNDRIDGDLLGNYLDGGRTEWNDLDGSDTLYGHGGADTLAGGLLSDVLVGGAGADTYLYSRWDDSTADDTDRIVGLRDADVIDLQAIDADTAEDGDQAFQIVEAFSGMADELVLSYSAETNRTLLLGDVDGDGQADLVIAIVGDHESFANFVL